MRVTDEVQHHSAGPRVAVASAARAREDLVLESAKARERAARIFAVRVLAPEVALRARVSECE